MKAIGIRALAVVGGLGLLAGPALAQSVSGTAYGAYVNALGVTSQSAVASVSDTGGFAAANADSYQVPSAVSANWLSATSSGAVGSGSDKNSGAQSVSELETVSVLSGVIRADVVTAVASSYVTGTGAGSNGTGSGFANLVVNGVAVITEVAPNTRVTLPGVGYAVLNEQTPSGDGVTSSGIRVTMIRVVLQDTLTGAKTGEIVVGSAASSVTR